MEHYALLFLDTAIVVSCAVMALVFLILPLPQNKGLHKYRISLRFLAGAYMIMALVKTSAIVFNVAIVNLIPMDGLVIASFQAPLFTFALITLINPQSIKKCYFCTQLIPILIFVFVFILADYKWGNPSIRTFAELRLNALQPTVIIRELFLLYYVYQLVYLIRIFSLHKNIYEKSIDNYFAENFHLQLAGVRQYFYSALIVGVLALTSCFILSPLWMVIFEISYSLFYVIFGLYYIQYPNKFTHIEPAIYPVISSTEKPINNKKRLVWDDFRHHVITNKYYLKPGVTIEDMAQYLKIGRTTLSTFINTEEKMNFNLWINSLRVEEAKCLLIDYPDYNLTQIAELIGYSEPSNFSRQFKLITNESPSVWRQSCQS